MGASLLCSEGTCELGPLGGSRALSAEIGPGRAPGQIEIQRLPGRWCRWEEGPGERP